MSRIFLIGYMGSGKTTVGKKLANRLNYDFIDLDECIEKEYQKTITQIFNEEGENAFREKEYNALKKMLTVSKTIISCGGGTPCFYNSMDLMNESGITIYLKMSSETLISRLRNAKQERPLLNDKKIEDLKSLIQQQLEKREYFYKQATYTIKAKDLNMDELFEFVKQQVI